MWTPDSLIPTPGCLRIWMTETCPQTLDPFLDRFQDGDLWLHSEEMDWKTPKRQLGKIGVSISGFSTLGSVAHRNRSESRSLSSINTMRKAFSMSPVSATLWKRKQRRMSKIDCPNFGPVYRQSFSDGP